MNIITKSTFSMGILLYPNILSTYVSDLISHTITVANSLQSNTLLLQEFHNILLVIRHVLLYYCYFCNTLPQHCTYVFTPYYAYCIVSNNITAITTLCDNNSNNNNNDDDDNVDKKQISL